jgi:hypothetical protein
MNERFREITGYRNNLYAVACYIFYGLFFFQGLLILNITAFYVANAEFDRIHLKSG